MTGAARPTVVAVVVAYRPDLSVLERVVAAAAPQVEAVLVVDDTGLGNGRVETLRGARVVHMPANRGVAAAQNVGIHHALSHGADFVLLLDQDSRCAPDMVVRLMSAVEEVSRRGVDLSAVGPRYADEVGLMSGFVRFGTFKFQSVPCPSDQAAVVEADFLISSGSLIPRSALERVGMMDETLFIDHVDTDWFLRARSLGLRCFGVCDALMDHSLGEGRARVWLGRWRQVPRHRPFRYYYMVRNSLLLYRRAYAPRRWIAGDLVRLMAMALLNVTMRGPRLERARMMLRGLWHGITGRHGPLTAPS